MQDIFLVEVFEIEGVNYMEEIIKAVFSIVKETGIT